MLKSLLLSTGTLFFLTISGCENHTAPLSNGVGNFHLVSGTVKTAGTDLAIEGAAVTTRPPTSTVSTDVQGRFVLHCDTAGTYNVRATRHPYIAAEKGVRVSLDVAASPVALVLRLSPPGYLELVLREVSDTSWTITARSDTPAETLRVRPGTEYLGSASVWNGTPRDSVLDFEIGRSKDAYRFVYAAENIPAGRVQITNLNRDNRAAEFGSRFMLQTSTGADAQGIVRVSLRFYPTLSKFGVNYETDFTALFPFILATQN